MWCKMVANIKSGTEILTFLELCDKAHHGHDSFSLKIIGHPLFWHFLVKIIFGYIAREDVQC